MNTRFVLDASAAVEVLAARNPDAQLRRRVLTGHAVATELIDVETISSLRRLSRCGLVSASTAERSVEKLQVLPVSRLPHRALIERIWELRHAITPYDAAYVALAERFDIPLITTDAKLAGSNGHHAEIELYPAS